MTTHILTDHVRAVFIGDTQKYLNTKISGTNGRQNDSHLLQWENKRKVIRFTFYKIKLIKKNVLWIFIESFGTE